MIIYHTTLSVHENYENQAKFIQSLETYTSVLQIGGNELSTVAVNPRKRSKRQDVDKH